MCRLSIALIGKFSLAGAFATVYLNTIELIPTQVRNLGVGVTSVGGRLGGILAPMILLLVSCRDYCINFICIIIILQVVRSLRSLTTCNCPVYFIIVISDV